MWSWALAGAGARGWADYAQQELGERACWACQARAAGGRERAWRAGLAGVRRADVLGRAERQAHGRWRERARAGERQLSAGAGGRQGAGRAAGPWARGRALGALQAGTGRAAGRRWARGRQALGARGARGLGTWAGLGQCTRCTRPIFDPF